LSTFGMGTIFGSSHHCPPPIGMQHLATLSPHFWL
jgi:hypothetical protein